MEETKIIFSEEKIEEKIRNTSNATQRMKEEGKKKQETKEGRIVRRFKLGAK